MKKIILTIISIFLASINLNAQTIKSISKPGSRIYYSLKQLWKMDSSKTFIIVSTNQGVKTLVDCKKLRIGGEPFFIIN